MTLGVRVLVQNPNGEILLVRHTYVPGWHLPGGGVDHGEDVYEAVAREVYEECGLTELVDLSFISLELNHAVSNRDHVSYFQAHTNQTPSEKRTGEIAEVKFIARDLALEVIAPEYRQFVQEHT